MAELSTDERCKLAVGLIEQAPPGEVKWVIPVSSVDIDEANHLICQ